ncbi:multidrug efflux system outer membrane protein [Rhodovulum iodosum]|uniref:Multidrug efflux system outer membrane protein n=1 Tax=Rhodovulum iodosum TaxID=68291 RepID=A0ABV3XY14_9RHOB|nr:efflux transporter outer membrane subunit [Rhodovulum robiginosum]RSK38860.1 efflux transporter outer membrane subunit [Rhodovulum robiginosum]
MTGRPQIRRRAAPVRGVRGALALGGALVLSGCMAPTPYDAPRFPFRAAYKDAPQARPVLLSNAAWWQRLEDPVLDALVARALAGNLSIKSARARLQEARASRAAVPGNATLTSSAALNAEGTDDRGPDGVGELDLGLNWLLDPYGGRAAERRAADARIEVADAETDAARLLVLSDIARAYLDLRYRQRLLALRSTELAGRRRTLGLTRDLASASSATRLDIARAEARVAEIQAEIPQVRADIASAKAQIAVLAGSRPGALEIGLAPGPQPRAGLAPEMGIPADLMRNRPDIRIAERRYYAAVAEIDVARAALYPSLSLTGEITLNALEGGQGAAAYVLGPALRFPALPTGAASAAVLAGHARARQAHLEWSSTVLGALRDVETALVDYRAGTEALSAAARAARLYGEAVTLTRAVFDRGEATLSDLIDAENDVSDANDRLALTLYRQALAFVDLNVQLGSGSAIEGSNPAPEG